MTDHNPADADADADAHAHADEARHADVAPPDRTVPGGAHSVSGYDVQPDDPDDAEAFGAHAGRLEHQDTTPGDSMGMRTKSGSTAHDGPAARTPPAPG